MSEDAGQSAPAAPEVAESQENQQEEVQEEQSTEGSVPEVAASSNEPSKTEVKAAANKVDAKQSKEDPSKFKIKVDGEEVELSREEMVKYAQMGSAAQKRMAEAATIRKEAAELVSLLRSDPARVLADPAILGSDERVIEFAQKVLAKRLEDEQKSPEVRQREQLEKELEDLRSKIKKDDEERKTSEYNKMIEQNANQLDEQITEAISSSGLPKSPFVLKRMADVMLSALENDKEITPKQAMNIVKREMNKDLKEFFDASPDEALEELLGEGNIKRLRKRHLSKIKAETPNTPNLNKIKEAALSSKDEPKEQEKISIKNWLRG